MRCRVSLRTAHGSRRGVLETNLAKAIDLAAPTGIDVLIEAINAVDMPGYFFTHTQQAADIIAAVGAPNFGLQLDLCLRHRVEGDAAGAIDCYAGITRYYQIAGPPDRGEPIPSDLNVGDVSQRIDASGFDGWVGCEYRPPGRTSDGLAWRKDLGVPTPANAARHDRV